MKWLARNPWTDERLGSIGLLAGLLFFLVLASGLRWPDAEAAPVADKSKAAAHAVSPARLLAAPPREKTVDAKTEASSRLRELLFPVPAVSPSAMANSFSDSRGKRVHHAVDILAPRNSEVVAVADGTIAKVLFSALGGNGVYQWSLDKRFVYYYAHLDAYAIDLEDGAEVHRGQVLGYVGTTGNAPPNTPHLHFAIAQVGRNARWWGGAPVNPYPIWR